MKGVANAAEFVDIGKLPKETVRIAAYDGENADPANGRKMSAKVRAYTPWGELAFGLGGEAGYRLVEKGDQSGIAPGAETLREFLGDKPCLILLDELSVYLRKLSGQATTTAAGQLTSFLTSLIKAVESSRKAALVYTLALGQRRSDSHVNWSG
jgi:predicted AAA+ superfamily ATPase